MNPFTDLAYQVPPLAIGVTCSILAIVIWRGTPGRFADRLFLGVVASTAVWSFLIMGMRLSPDVVVATLWDRPAAIIFPSTFVLFYHFTLVYTNNKGQRGLLLTSYISFGILAGFAPTNLLIESMRVESYGYAPNTGPAGFAIAALAVLLMIGSAYNLIKRYRISRSLEERNRLLYLFVALTFPFVGGLIDGFSNLPPVVIWANLAFCILCSIAIIKYQLLDIRVVARRSLTYIALSGLVAGLYLGVMFLIEQFAGLVQRPWWLNVIIIGLIAFSLRPLYTRLQHRLDRVFYRDRLDFLLPLEQIGNQARSIHDLNKMAGEIVKLLSGALRSKEVCLLAKQQNKELRTLSSTGLSKAASEVSLASAGLLVKWLKQHKSTVAVRDLDVFPELQNIGQLDRQSLAKLKADLIVPVPGSGSDLSGLIVLGRKSSGEDYSIEERRWLSTVANQVSMNLENARLFQETKQSAKALAESERRFRTMIESAPTLLTIVDVNGCVVYASPNCQQFTGYTRNELEGKAIGWVHPSDLARMQETFDRIIHERLPGGSFECKAFKKNGDIWYASSSWQPLVSESGELLLISQTIDVSEQKRAALAVRESEEKLRLIFKSLACGVFVVNLSHEIFEANEAVAVIHGYDTTEKLIGKRVFELVAPEDQDKILDMMNLALEEGHSGVLECSFVRTNGNLFPGELSFALLKDASGNPAGLVAVSEDVSLRHKFAEEKREMERKAQMASRLALVGEMAAGIAHEINNPLTGVIGFAQRLMRHDLPADARRSVELVYEGAQRVASISSRFLSFSRSHSPDWKYVDINAIVDKALALRHYELQTDNIEVITRLDAHLPSTMADEGQLQQVFLNIIINAETEMKLAHGRGKLTVQSKRKDSLIYVSFEDNGPGIAKEDLGHVFEPFFTTREAGQGTGLGLSLSRRMIAQHGGRIYATSHPGKGATFVIELPIMEKQEKSESDSPIVEPQASNKGRILVVDDEPSVLEFLAHVLSEEGHKVDTVSNGTTALEKISAEVYDLVLLDVRLPQVGGIEVYYSIERMSRRLARKVVLITADINGADTRSFLKRTGAKHLAKPFDTNAVKRVVHSILQET